MNSLKPLCHLLTPTQYINGASCHQTYTADLLINIYIYNSSKDAIPETVLKESASSNHTVEPVNIVLRA